MTTNSLPLNDDLIDRIFTFSADFETQLALQSTCKALRAIFRTHPKSITLAVARNLTDRFPEALRILRQTVDGRTGESSDDNDDSPDHVQRPESEDLDPLTTDELPELRKNDVVVRKLECIFSRWYQDRKALASVLSPEESFRFRRAMYRVMLFSARFTSIGCKIDDEYEDPEVLRKRQSKVLAVYTTAELYEIHSVVLFLRHMIRLVLQQPPGNDDATIDICLAAGPALILATYESRDTDTMAAACPLVDYGGDGRFQGFFYEPMADIWAARDSAAHWPPNDSAHLRSILETVPDGLDSCACLAFRVDRQHASLVNKFIGSQCGDSTHGLRWTSATWQDYKTDLPFLLPSRLALDLQETTALRKFLQETTDTLPHLDVLIAGIFRDVVPLNAGFEGWTEEDGLCGDCLERLLKEHTHLWLLKQKIQEGWVPPEDCWYGYACKTQLKNAAHAIAKNHLCKPTKGSRIAVIQV
ncbi:hypothetical protein C8R46DRAFT_1192222 [Mycena filopes]|nr:hypothetical protein C8R46DRAFT_1192222 [Mycena filopes]